MKSSLLFWFLCIVEIYQAWCILPPDMSKAIHIKCQKEIGTTEEEIIDLRKANFHLDNQQQICYFKCVLAEMNVMDQSGKLTPLAALKFLPPTVIIKMRPIMGACGTVDDKNPCLKAAKLYRCVHQKLPNLYYVP